MADDDAAPPIRLMNFVSEDQLAEARKNRGARVEDGTAQRDRPLFEILKENKDKKDAEFNERFKHRPPKALDEDETEFLENVDKSKREYERQIAEEEEQYLRSFQAAVESQYNVVHELKETPSAPKDQDKSLAGVGKRNPTSRPLGMVIKVKPQPKRAKLESKDTTTINSDHLQSGDDSKGKLTGLVSYSDDSEEEE